MIRTLEVNSILFRLSKSKLIKLEEIQKPKSLFTLGMIRRYYDTEDIYRSRSLNNLGTKYLHIRKLMDKAITEYSCIGNLKELSKYS